MSKVLYIGIDEVGRGPIAGPVVVGAVLYKGKNNFNKDLSFAADSKKLTQKKREEFNKKILELQKKGIVKIFIEEVSNKYIDQNGIVNSITKATNKILRNMKNVYVYVDYGIKIEKHEHKSLIKGDEINKLIGAASIVAKCYRDKKMVNLSKKIDSYSFEKNKGYGTKEHYDAIRKKGLSKVHRKSFIKI